MTIRELIGQVEVSDMDSETKAEIIELLRNWAESHRKGIK